MSEERIDDVPLAVDATDQSAHPGSGRWERELLEKLATAALKEQRRARRWGIFFKLLGFSYLFLLLALYYPVNWETPTASVKPHTGLVDLKGIISATSDANAERIIKGLRNAFEDKKTKGVVLRINSPGGSPVQSSEINHEITRLRKKYPDKHLYAVCTDVCASGAYYVAVAADRIYVDKASIVGSIGVRMDSFGFVDAMKKLGVERRLMTAGEHKGILDPFLPERKDEVQYIHTLLENIHQQFIDAVRKGRGKRLKETPDIFSGLFWTGEQGVQLGLADGFATADEVARKVIGAEEIVDYTPEPDVWERISRRLGASLSAVVDSLAHAHLD